MKTHETSHNSLFILDTIDNFRICGTPATSSEYYSATELEAALERMRAIGAAVSQTSSGQYDVRLEI